MNADDSWFKAVQPCFATTLSLFAGLAYFIHFNFANGMLRLIYLVFIVAFPLVSIVSNLVVGNSLSRIVLDEQEKLPLNAEFLDYEDDESDIMRKATISTVQKRIKLQRWVMTPLYLSGWFKILKVKDFAMQVYFGYLIEMTTFTLPLSVIQLINNAMLDRWNLQVTISLCIMALSFIIDLKGIFEVGDVMTEHTNQLQRKKILEKHRMQQKIISNKGKP